LFNSEDQKMAPSRLIAMLDGWVREAVARHGDNWPAIMAALEENLDGLEKDQRAELSGQIALLLATSSDAAHSELH
jgi:hypothetical protein